MNDLHSIDAVELSGVTGGGLFGAAWRAAKRTYHVAKPHIGNASPFAYIGYKAHSLWHRSQEQR
jgi:hypothetical protein